jgi:hypothetical protein
VARSIADILRGIVGTSDGSTTGTKSVWKIVSGIGSVVETSASDIKAYAKKIADEVTTGSGLLVRQPTAANFNCTEASAATIAGRLVNGADSAAALLNTIAGRLVDSGAITVGNLLKKIADEVTVGNGLKVNGAVTTSGTVIEASASDIKTAVQLIDNPVVAQNGTASDAMTAGVELCDPTAPPANGTATKIRRMLANLAGMPLVYLAHNIEGEDSVAHRMRVEEEWSNWSSAIEGQVKGSAGKIGRIHIVCTTAGSVTVYDSLTETGTILDVFPMLINTSDRQTFYVAFGTGLFVGFDATFAGRVSVTYR